MKRFIILLNVLLYCIMLKAQTETYTCRYWFDQNHTQAVITTFSNSTWQTELDIGQLTAGIHKLRLQVADTSMKWSSPQTYLFFKIVDTLQEDLTCHYWFDQNHGQKQHLPFGNGNLLLNVSDLEDGLHTVNILLEGENLTTSQNYSFVKVAIFDQDSLDMSNLMYHCWFDQDFEHRQTDSVGDGHFLLDVSELTDGLHTVNVLLEGDVLTTTTSYMFMKVAVDDPSVEYKYHCWFDNDFSTKQTGSVGLGVFELEVSGLSNGIHTVSVMLENSMLSAPQCYMFYKRPVDGYIAKWEYWLNGDTDNRHTTSLSPCVDTLDIVTLLPLETWPVRSTCFHFQPNGDNPYIIAKNEITFRFWDVDKHFIDKSSFYIDENVSETIVADTLERNTTASIDAPRDNQIHWFKMEVGRGDYMSFQASKACTIQLFAPSGEEVYTASGPESILMNGLNVWEDGTYYLAVHDVTGSGETVSVTYNWLNRYAVASYDVHLVGNGGCSTITFQGNGFNSLLDAYLVNWQNDTIRSLDIGHESNTTTTVSLNFYQENLGVYDAVFEFYEETIRVNGALEVQEPVDIQLTTTVSYPSVFLRNTPCTYTFTITNEGNMTAYNVPLYVYIATDDLLGLYSIHIDGLETQSYYDCMKDLFGWSEVEKRNLKEYSDIVGVDYYFAKSIDVGENGVDSVLIRSGNFFLEIPPYTSRTIKLKLTSYSAVDTWFTCPNEWLPCVEQQNHLVFFDGSSRLSQWDFCCWHTDLENILNGFGIAFSAASMAMQLFAAASLGAAGTLAAIAAIPGVTIPAGLSAASLAILGVDAEFVSLFFGIVGCVSSGLSTISSETANIMCNGEQLSIGDRRISFGGTVASCLSVPLSALPIAGNTVSLAGIAGGVYSIKHNKKNPDCTDEPSKGGKSDAVNGFDPNDIYGYLSESGSHYMRQEIQNVQYEIEFENDTTLATAAAHTIIVRDTLDAAKFDLNSLAARSVTIGDKRLELNGEQTFARTLDLRPEIYVIAQVDQDYDPTTGIIQWTIQSLDPMTMEPTDDPNQGVLPVNYYGDGVGFIDYSINLKEAFDDGTEINNRAGIIFDQEEVIMTPTWTNIIDAVKPTSHIESVEVVNDSLSFNFVSSDNRSGVWYHSLYYRNASTEQEWQVKKAQIFEDSFKLPFDSLQTTEYFVIAVDSAGNVEAMKTEAEVVVESSVSGYPLFVAGYGESTNAGWKFIASPVAGSISATMVDSIFSATQYDLYYFDQSNELEWRNYKSNSFNLTNGQGYLYATKEDKTLIFRGAYNEADAYEVPLVYTGVNPHTDMRGWNLIGNPFTVPAYVDRSYYTMNEEGTAIEPVAVSNGSPIPACHGVMVKAETSGEKVTFSRTAQQNAPNQGNIQIAVTQATTRGNTMHDKAIVSFNSSDQLGKFNFNESNAKVYIPQDGKDYAIAYATKTGEIPVNFKAAKGGTYTINVNADGMEFNYLHLIDNLTGADVDLLTESSYTFEAKTTDYASRFRLVFSVSGDADGDNAPFAFINNGNIIIIGAEADATLQIVDVLGRVLVCRDVSHASAISTSGMVQGVYLLRLINGDEIRTQKIVID